MGDKKDKKKDIQAFDKFSPSTKPSSSRFNELLLSARDVPASSSKSKTQAKSALEEKPPILSARDKSSAKSSSQEKSKSKVSEPSNKHPKLEPDMKSRPPSGTKSIFRTKEDEKFASQQLKIGSLSKEDRKKQEDWAQKQLKGRDTCPEGFLWDRFDDQKGYRCQGQTHFVTDKLLAEGKGGVLFLNMKITGEVEWSPPYYADPKKPGRYVYGGPLRDGKHPFEQPLARWINGKMEMMEIKIEDGKMDPALKEYLTKHGTQVSVSKVQAKQRLEVKIEGGSMDPAALKELLAKHGAKVSKGEQQIEVKVGGELMDPAALKEFLAKYGIKNPQVKKN
ncbi:hypothetical protein BDZ45DRAFT_695136 [Acephala macrosclerotiorum]|nr:hypothetical protein BDZ45DRAFT_695136 [Acephala macrosclerotiorum]